MRTLKIAATFWMAAGAVCYGASDRLEVFLFDQVGAPHWVLAKAAEEARRTFAAAGVETAWTICEGPEDSNQTCALPPAGTYVQLRIVPEAPEGRLLSRDALGYAAGCPPTEGCFISWVFYHRVLAYADHTDQLDTMTLACVMAHEIGHLMGMGHSPRGIMKAKFDRHDLLNARLGLFRFSEDDAKRFRAAVALWTAVTKAAAADSFVLRVYVQDSIHVDATTLAEAERVTSRIFAAAGIRVEWKVGDPRRNETAAVRIQFDATAEPGLHTDTAAYAQPFAHGAAIHVFCDRVLHTGPRPLAPILLGHVMAHEIGHVLEGADRHSPTGVMKAHWTRDDYGEMLRHPLSFAPEDVRMIRDHWNPALAGTPDTHVSSNHCQSALR